MQQRVVAHVDSLADAPVPIVALEDVAQHCVTQMDGVLEADAQCALQVSDAGVAAKQHGLAGT